jgi:hypothetical protein
MKKIFALSLVLAALVGCSSGSSSLSPADIAGTFFADKVTVTNNVGVSTTAVPPTLNGSLILGADGSFTVVLTVVGVGTSAGAGTYTLADPAITFVFSGGAVINGQVSNGGKMVTLTWPVGANTWTAEFVK